MSQLASQDVHAGRQAAASKQDMQWACFAFFFFFFLVSLPILVSLQYSAIDFLHNLWKLNYIWTLSSQSRLNLVEVDNM